MKALKVLVATVLLFVCGLAVSDSVFFVNLLDGDEVNGNRFTIVAQGEAYASGDELTITVKVINNTRGEVGIETINVTVR